MQESQNDQTELKLDAEAVSRVLRIINNSSFRGAGAKSVVEVLNFLDAIRTQMNSNIGTETNEKPKD